MAIASSSSASAIDLSLILPLYNEGALLESNLLEILNTVDHAIFRTEIILIDDASQDSSATIGQRFAAAHPDRIRFFRHPQNKGRGATVMDGFRLARGRVVGYFDVDCEGSPTHLLNFVPDILEDRADVITGRRVYPLSLLALPRILISMAYRRIEQFILDVSYGDRQTGYKFFRANSILPLLDYVQYPGWFWDTEIMCLAEMARLRIEERPITFLRNPEKQSTVRVVRDSWQMFREMIIFRSRFRSLKTSFVAPQELKGSGVAEQ